MTAFIPTHYTARMITFHDGHGLAHTRASGEAVMHVETGRRSGGVARLRVVCGDGHYAWLDADDVYTGPRRD